VTLVVRAAPGVDAITTVRREISAIDEKLTPFDARSMPEQIDQLMFPVQAALWTYSFIGVFGLILASVGLAGVTAYSVARRRREIGIRVALGASSGDVLRLVMREGSIVVAAGTVIGLALAWAAMRALAAALSVIASTSGRNTSTPVLLIGAPLLLAAVALVACYLPARESLRVDPIVALRQE
jgi:putative ABC transport system permease protein